MNSTQAYLAARNDYLTLENAPSGYDAPAVSQAFHDMKAAEAALNGQNPWRVEGKQTPITFITMEEVAALKSRTLRIGDEFHRIFTIVSWATKPIQTICQGEQCMVTIDELNAHAAAGSLFLVEARHG